MSELDGVDGDSVAAEAVMLRDEHNRAILIVEGSDDGRFFSKFLDEAECELIVAFGKANALRAIQRLEAEGLPGVVCVVDADYDELLGVHHATNNLIRSDERDIEVMMMKSSALMGVIRELGVAGKIRAIPGGEMGIREILMKAAKPIGILRIYSISNNLWLKFKGISYDFVDRDLQVDVDKMVKVVLNNSKMANVARGEFVAYIGQRINCDFDYWKLCAGHDLSAILGRSLQRKLGSRSSGEVGGATIETHLRLAYDCDDFRQSAVFRSMREWEARNSPHRILREAI